MTQQYASQQPKGFKNHIEKIAIVGVGGHMGGFITKALLANGKHSITAISRIDSKSEIPEGVNVARVDYSSQESLAAALKGHDALIITMNTTAPPEAQQDLIDAASTAGVPWVMPNYYGHDLDNEELGREMLIGPRCIATRDYLKKKENVSAVGLTCSFWYEWSLCAFKFAYGFDVEKKEALFFDDGNTKILTSTWPRAGEAVAKLFSLPVLPEDENDKQTTLSQFKDKLAYVSSFYVSQKDMFASILRVTGTKESEWKIEYKPVKELYAEGQQLLQKGEFVGFGTCLYTRLFFPGDEGNFSDKLNNDVLGLTEKEDLDEATKRGIEFAKEFKKGQ